MPRIMIEVDAEYQPLADAFGQLLQNVRTHREAAAGGAAVDYTQAEQEFAACACALERAAHQVVLQALDVDAPHIEVEGTLYRRVLRSFGNYYSMAGPVEVERSLYRKAGERQGATVDAISLRIGAVADGWLPTTAGTMAWECQRAPSREAEAAAERWRRLPYSRSAFEHMMHEVGTHDQKGRAVIERELVESLPIPAAAHSISVSLDRVSIPMEQPRPRPKDLPLDKPPKRPIKRVFKMAWAATVTLHDEKGQALHTLRYGRMPQADVDELVTALADDVMTMLKACPTLLVVLLCDGAKDLWTRLAAEFNPNSLGRPVYRLVDLWHLLEKLSAAAKLIYGDEQAPAVRTAWRLSLLNEENAIASILQTLVQSGKESIRTGDSRPVHEAITYLRNHKKDMNYAKARALGLPVGSGNVEATCKSLFEVRLKRPGCRFKEETGSHLVDLRALDLSDRFAPAVSRALAPLRKSVSAVADLHPNLSCAA